MKSQIAQKLFQQKIVEFRNKELCLSFRDNNFFEFDYPMSGVSDCIFYFLITTQLQLPSAKNSNSCFLFNFIREFNHDTLNSPNLENLGKNHKLGENFDY